jgi:hypothetical protein
MAGRKSIHSKVGSNSKDVSLDAGCITGDHYFYVLVKNPIVHDSHLYEVWQLGNHFILNMGINMRLYHSMKDGSMGTIIFLCFLKTAYSAFLASTKLRSRKSLHFKDGNYFENESLDAGCITGDHHFSVLLKILI